MADSKSPTLAIIECSNSAIADLLSDTEKILSDIEEYSNITREYKFRNIKAYGNSENPYFQANCIFDYLFPHYLKNFSQLDTQGQKTTLKNRKRQFSRWIKENFQDENGNLVDCDIIKANIKRNADDIRYYECYVLSETGVLVAFCKQKSALATTFRKHLVKFIKNVRKYHLEIYNEERVRSVKDLTKQLEAEVERRQEAETKVGQSLQLFDAFHNPNDISDHDSKELKILQRETQKQYYVYVVDWRYINTKYWKKFPITKKQEVKLNQPPKKNQIEHTDLYCGINPYSSDSDYESKNSKKKVSTRRNKADDSEPHPDGIQESYDLFDINLGDLERDENEEMYFSIRIKEVSNTKKEYYKFVRFVYIKDIKHYKEMIEIILHGNVYTNQTAYPINNTTEHIKKDTDVIDNYNTNTPVSDVYKATYANVIDARNSSFINSHKDVLMNEKKRRTTAAT